MHMHPCARPPPPPQFLAPNPSRPTPSTPHHPPTPLTPHHTLHPPTPTPPPQIMRILDQDPIVSKALRDPTNLDDFVREFARKRRN